MKYSLILVIGFFLSGCFELGLNQPEEDQISQEVPDQANNDEENPRPSAEQEGDNVENDDEGVTGNGIADDTTNDDSSSDGSSNEDAANEDVVNEDGDVENEEDEPEVIKKELVRSSIAPHLSKLEDKFIDHKGGENLSVSLQVDNLDELNGELHWVKIYGPDDVIVHPQTGMVTWDIPDDMPSESFHIGIKASALNESISSSFIVHAGVTEVVTVGETGDYETIKQGLKAMSSGGTLIVLDGVYAGDSNFIGLTLGGALNHPPSGDAGAYTTVMAKNPGKVILKDGAYVRLHGNWPVSYAAFKGFFVIDGQMAAFGSGKSKAESTYRNHHIKFIMNGVQGGETKSPFNAFRSDDILFENNYAFGGGRYKFTSYQAENIVWRRNVARYDRGTVWNEPKGTYSVYTTKNAFLGNNIAIDGDNPDFVYQGELAGEFTTPTTSGDTSAKFQRNMQINSAFLFGNMDEQISGGGGDSEVEHTDVVSWDVKPYSRYIMTWGSAWFNHMTMGNIRPENYSTNLFNGYHENTRGLTNSLMHNFQNGDVFYGFGVEASNEIGGKWFDRFGVDTVNMTQVEGTMNVYRSDIVNTTNHDPFSVNGGLKYLTRIEPGSQLSGKAKDGGDLGATVMTFVGKSGTMAGEDGYDQETDIPMWPFPMEDIIKEKFSEYTFTGTKYTGHYTSRSENGTGTINGQRGFAVPDQSLTNYIWGYLGALVPPMNVSANVDEEGVVVQWENAAEKNKQEILGYKVYSYDRDTGSKTLLIELDSSHKLFHYKDMNAESPYSFVVTAINEDSESGYSYPVEVNTH